MSAPRQDLQWWTTSDVADYLGVCAGTVCTMRARGLMPPPDVVYGRTALWIPQTVIGWSAEWQAWLVRALAHRGRRCR